MTDRLQVHVWAATAELMLAHVPTARLGELAEWAFPITSDGSLGLVLGIAHLLRDRALAVLDEQAA
jgi:hypothetical protein